MFDDMSNVVDVPNEVFGGWGLDIETEVQLDVTKGGTGTGTVTSAPAGISCAGDGSQCNALFPADSTVVLTASPAAGSSFASWTGCPSPSGNQCTVTMDQERTVNANFNVNPRCRPRSRRSLP